MMKVIMQMFGGIEAGGTKFICAVGSGYGEIISQTKIETTDHVETLSKVVEFFQKNPVSSIGVGCFGPIDLSPDSSSFGTILNTPKPGWQGVNIYRTLLDKFNLPIAVVTDTDVSAIGEQFHGKSVNTKSSVYLTIGTGIGGTVIVNDDIVHGISHPEIGHIRLPAFQDHMGSFGGCTYHENCFEGLASGKSLEIRYNIQSEILNDAVAWQKEAYYIALGVVNVISMLQPEIIILGGSVMKRKGLINDVRKYVIELINNYYQIPDIESYIVRSSGDTIGVVGSIKLASKLIQNGGRDGI